jgi:hypothetical protein
VFEVADILRRYGGDYLDRFGDAIPKRHRRAIRDIIDCRTPVFGGHVYACDRCGQKHFSYHSCGNRHCPKCHGHNVEAWIDARRTELLPVPYFHLVFTLPQQLRRIVRAHPRSLYGILMKAAARALMKLAADPRYVGGQLGILAVLHTWTRTLEYHPHVHCLVPGGGLSPEGNWVPSRSDYLVPVKALSRIFRGVFADLTRKTCPDITLPQSIWNRPWIVYAKPAVQGTDHVLTYLGRYVHRVAIANSRIISIDNGRIVFRYQRAGETQWKTMALSAREFIRRFLQHVLPAGVHKVRYYGLWAPANRQRLHDLQDKLAKLGPDPSERQTPEPVKEMPQPHPLEGGRCPHCRMGVLRWSGVVDRKPRAPP